MIWFRNRKSVLVGSNYSVLIAISQNTSVPNEHTGASQRTGFGRPLPATANAIPATDSRQPHA